MQSTDRVKLYEALNGLSELYGKELSDGALKLWFDALVRFELNEITAGLTRHVNDPDTGQFFPKPADVVRNIEGGKLDRASIAWTTVEKSISKVGGYESVCFDDPISQKVISDMGGWIRLCEVTFDELPFKANEFKKRYQGYIMRPPVTFPKILIGIAQADNEANNKPVAPPIMIGNEEKAKRVYLSGSKEVFEVKPMIGHVDIPQLEQQENAA